MTFMDALKRFFGIAGNNTARAKVIASIAERSTEESRQLNAQLRQYQQSDDPFKAMVIDLTNKRTDSLMSSRKWHEEGL